MRKIIAFRSNPMYRSNPMLDFCFRLLHCSAINAYAVVICYSRESSNGARLKQLPDRAKCWGHSLVLSQPTMLLLTRGVTPGELEVISCEQIVRNCAIKCIIDEALKVRGQKYDKIPLKSVEKALKWPSQCANFQKFSGRACPEPP